MFSLSLSLSPLFTVVLEREREEDCARYIRHSGTFVIHLKVKLVIDCVGCASFHNSIQSYSTAQRSTALAT